MNNYNSSGKFRNQPRQDNSRHSAAGSAPHAAKPLPADYVDEAEKLILQMKDTYELLQRNKDWKQAEKQGFTMTTSKLRNIFSLISDIYNYENTSIQSELSEISQNKIQLMRIRMLYEAGRGESIKDFVEQCGLLSYIKDIGTDRKKFINFYHYMEALIAYHRYYGGKES